jgi:hypothetical protein
MLVGLLLLPLPGRAEDTACAASPSRVGECFTVHGRLTACGGSPAARIWIVGTQRILGVVAANGHPAGDNQLPEWLEAEMFAATPCSKAAFGDFTVCPLTSDRPGVMRSVCVTSAEKVIIKEW